MTQIIYPITELKDIYQDSKKLNEEIERSKGFILHQLDFNNLLPNIDFLLENVSLFSLYFINKNYKLTEEQKDKIANFYPLSESEKNSVKLSEEEVIQYLKVGKSIPENTILSYNIFLNHIEEVIAQSTNNYQLESIIGNSAKLLTKEQILSLPEDFLIDNNYLFLHASQYFKEEDYKEKYVNVLRLANVKHKRERYNSYFNVRYFEDYHFTIKDTELLKELLEDSSLTLPEFNALHGANEIMDKWDFHLNYSRGSLDGFSIKEIEENIDIVRETYLQPRFGFSGVFKRILDLELSQVHSDLILTDDYIKYVIEKPNQRYRGDRISTDRDDYKIRLATAKLQEKFINIIMNDLDKYIKTVELSELTSYFTFINSYDYDNEILKRKDEILITFINEKIKQDFPSILSYRSEFHVEGLGFHVVKSLDSNINLLYLLLSKYNSLDEERYGDKQTKDQLKQIIKDKLPSLNKGYAQQLLSYFNFREPLIVNYKDSASIEYRHNFLNYSSMNIVEIPDKILNLLVNISEKFRFDVLKNNIQLPEDVEYGLFSLEDKRLIKFVKNYITANKERIENNDGYMEKLLSRPNYKEVISVDVNKSNESNFNIQKYLGKALLELVPLIKEDGGWGDFSEEEKEIIKSFIDKKTLVEEIKKNPDWINKIKNINDEVKQMGRKTYASLSHDFKQKVFKEMIKNKDFKTISELTSFSWSQESNLFFDYVGELNYKELMENLNDINFVNIIASSFSTSYGFTPPFKFKNFTSEENNNVAEKLFETIKEPTIIPSYFNEKSRGFEAEFYIRNCPDKIFSDYSLLKCKYTNDQIVRAYVASGKGYLEVSDVNFKISNFYSSVYRDREEDYLELLELAKPHPLLYLSLVNINLSNDYARNNLQKNGDLPKGYIYDKGGMEYFIKHFDFDILCKGVEEVIQKVKEFKADDKNYGRSNSHYISLISSFVYAMSYDVNVGNDVIFYSDISEKQTEKLINILLPEASSFLYGTSNLGSYTKFSENFALNFEKYAQLENINDKLLFPDHYFEPANYSTNGRFKTYIENITEGMINHYVSEGKTEDLLYMDYLVKQYKYSKELDYDYQYKVFQYSGVIDNLLNQPFMVDMISKSVLKTKLDTVLPVNEVKTKKAPKL